MLDLSETKIEVDGHRAEIGQGVDTNPLFPSVEFERSTVFVARIGMKLSLDFFPPRENCNPLFLNNTSVCVSMKREANSREVYDYRLNRIFEGRLYNVMFRQS